MSALGKLPAQDEDELPASTDGEAMPADPMPEAKQVPREIMMAAVAGVIGKLQQLADRQVQLKQAIEQRWLEDIRQFQGRYSVATEQALKDANKSKLFVNLTRAKCNSWEARLSDLLFPTDDKNWGIQPTPAPHLSAAVMQALNIAKQAANDATAAHQGGDPAAGAAIAATGTSAAQVGASIQDAIDEAEKRCALMESEIDTQLKESDYNIRSRLAIRDAIKLGTGIMKGPVTNQKLRRNWVPAAVGTPPANENTAGQPGAPQPGAAPATPPSDVSPTTPGTAYVLNQQPDPAPEFLWVDPWSYFPDMSARTPDEAEFSFERHLWNAKQLRKALKTQGLDPEACTQLLNTAPTQSIPWYWAQLREITANSTIIGMEKRYQVWEYHGVLEDEDLQSIASATGDTTVMQFVADNPLLEIPVIMLFCQGQLLKFAPYPLDSGESMYSVINFEPDDTSIFGFGVPYLQRDSQAALNGAWRMMMDNGGLSVGPQIVMDTDAVKPADGTWTLRPMKVWLKSSSSLTNVPESYKPFETFNITANQTQLQAIVSMAEDFADKETSMPLIAAGGIPAGVGKTTGGMSMLMNSANVIFRRVVKNIDDRLSVPNIRRMYDWNMQFSKRDDIKGDYAIDARGSSVLLVKEMQTQTLMSSLQNFAVNPVVGPMLKTANLVRKLFQAQMIHADDAVKSDDEIAKDAAARAQAAAPPPTGPSPEELAQQLTITREANANKLQVAGMTQQTALIVLAQKLNMTVQQLNTELQINQQDIQHRERIFAAELGTQATDGKPNPVATPTDFAGPGIKT